MSSCEVLFLTLIFPFSLLSVGDIGGTMAEQSGKRKMLPPCLTPKDAPFELPMYQ